MTETNFLSVYKPEAAFDAESIKDFYKQFQEIRVLVDTSVDFAEKFLNVESIIELVEAVKSAMGFIPGISSYTTSMDRIIAMLRDLDATAVQRYIPLMKQLMARVEVFFKAILDEPIRLQNLIDSITKKKFYSISFISNAKWAMGCVSDAFFRQVISASAELSEGGQVVYRAGTVDNHQEIVNFLEETFGNTTVSTSIGWAKTNFVSAKPSDDTENVELNDAIQTGVIPPFVVIGYYGFSAILQLMRHIRERREHKKRMNEGK